MDANALFQIDPMAAISYAQYNSVKENDGSFEDFLLHYDSYSANEGDNNWLTNLITENGGLNKLGSSGLLSSLDLSSFDMTSTLSSSDFLATKADAYKATALALLQQKGYDNEELEALETINNFKNPLLG